MALEVTVRDTETGETETTLVQDYVLVCAAPCHLAHRTAHRNGTHTLTVKNATSPGFVSATTFEPPRSHSTQPGEETNG